MTADRVCPTHPDARWVTVQQWTHCQACDTARKREWTRKRRAAGLLPAQQPAALARRRERDRETYAWKQAHKEYLELCDRLGIPDLKETA